MKQPKGVRLYLLTRCDGCPSEFESRGVIFVRRATIKPCPSIEGLVRHQTGETVTCETRDGDVVFAMRPRTAQD